MSKIELKLINPKEGTFMSDIPMGTVFTFGTKTRACVKTAPYTLFFFGQNTSESYAPEELFEGYTELDATFTQPDLF